MCTSFGLFHWILEENHGLVLGLGLLEETVDHLLYCSFNERIRILNYVSS